MKLSKIGSVNTYIRCLRQLDSWEFIRYEPSRNISLGSRIHMITFDNTGDHTTDHSGETALRHSKKQEKTFIKPLLKEVEVFFEM